MQQKKKKVLGASSLTLAGGDLKFSLTQVSCPEGVTPLGPLVRKGKLSPECDMYVNKMLEVLGAWGCFYPAPRCSVSKAGLF